MGRLHVGPAVELVRTPIADLGIHARPPQFLLPTSVDLLRPEDLVLLHCTFQNLRWGPADAAGAPTLIRAESQRPAFLAVRFASQHIIERAYFETAGAIPTKGPDPVRYPNAKEPDAGRTSDDPLDPPPVWASLAGPSSLVFRVEDETIVYSTEGILDAMSRLPLAVAPNALPPRSAVLRPWREMVDAGLLEVLGTTAVAHPLTGATSSPVSAVDLVSDAVAVSRASRTAHVLEKRFGTESALKTLAGTRIGAKAGVDRVIDVGVRVLLKPQPAKPSDIQTAIELPWRLIVSPNEHGAWAHSLAPVDRDGRIELWHTRMGTRTKAADGSPDVNEGPHRDRTIRAIWARDWDELPPKYNNTKFKYTTTPTSPTDFPEASQDQDRPEGRTSLSSRDRMMLVHETSNFRLKRGSRDWDPPAVPVDRLMLTTMGGWLESRVLMPTLPAGPFSIEEWKHRAAMGRDHEVKVVYAGFLLPFGHKASLVKVTERKIKTANDGRPVAYLFQRMFIIVKEPEKQYNSTTPFADGVRPELAMPLQMVRILTRVTPDLDPPGRMPDQPNGKPELFVPKVGGTPFLFKILAVDRENNTVEYRGPLAFIDRSITEPTTPSTAPPSPPAQLPPPTNLQAALDLYGKLADDRVMPLSGQRLAFADGDKPDDTALATDRLTFGAKLIKNASAINQDDVRFLPVLDRADVVVPSMSALAGAAQVIGFGYPETYRKNGFAGNVGQVFFEALDPPTKLDFAGQGDRSGGFVTPSLKVDGLSRLTGPINAVDDAIAGNFVPKNFFEGVQAKLFGVVALADLLEAVDFDPANVPTFVGQALDVATTLAENVRRLASGIDAVKAQVGNTADTLETALTTFATDFATFTANPSGAVDGTKITDDLKAIKDALGPFADNLDKATAAARAELEQIRGLVSRVTDQLEDVVTIGKAIVALASGQLIPDVVSARLDWSTKIPRYALGKPTKPTPTVENAIISPIGANGQAAEYATLRLAVDLQAPTVANKQPSALISCSISALDLQLVAPATFMVLHFKTFEFSVAPGKKPDVNVVFADNAIEFKGPLAFVEALKEFVPFDGFSDPPYLDVTVQGINAGFTLAIPNLSVGIFSLENVSVGAKLIVPFIDDSLQVGFNFCTRENPFRLSVMLFAGGGFVGVTVTPNGVKVLEAALEFGAAVSMNFGVASGSLSAMAGIYFKFEMVGTENQCTLTGYFRLRGEVDVLGLISASIELYLAFSYEPKPANKAVGQAILTIEVEVAFFSTTVKISTEKKFAGSGGDPTFEQQMGLRPGAPAGEPRPWDVYARAFA